MKRAVLAALLLCLVPAGAAAADDRPASTRFAVAIERGDVEAITALLDEGNKPDTHIDYGENWITPLMKAAWDGEKEIAEVLLAAGADVNAQAPGWGETALGQAVSRDHVEIARLLIDKGAKLESRNKQGFTPLKYAVAAGSEPVARALVAGGAKVDKPGTKYNKGETALHMAITQGKPEMVKVLLELKANPNARLANGDTPLKLARNGDQEDVVKMLKAAGAK
ncbi:hypothetical protein FBQ97_03020 [Acidobacteria bacterium ACD]|nr:hypothetical protein [Acidobacteria bacterium ACD]